MARVNRALLDLVVVGGGGDGGGALFNTHFHFFVLLSAIFVRSAKNKTKYLYRTFPLAILWFGSHLHCCPNEYMYNFNEIIFQINGGHIQMEPENKVCCDKVSFLERKLKFFREFWDFYRLAQMLCTSECLV